MARKKKEEVVEEKKLLELTHIYKHGDNILEIAEALTGHEYLYNRLLRANGTSLNELKEGDILKWTLTL